MPLRVSRCAPRPSPPTWRVDAVRVLGGEGYFFRAFGGAGLSKRQSPGIRVSSHAMISSDHHRRGFSDAGGGKMLPDSFQR